jgi:pilus assembly protein CpaD
MSAINHALRIASVAAVLLAGSCALDQGAESPDGAVNHPILVEPMSKSLTLPFSAPEAGLMPDDAQRFDGFVAEYAAEGTGAISISAPEGPDSQAAIAYFAQRLISAGIDRSRILVGTHDAGDSEKGVELSFIGYSAHTAPCGDYSDDLAKTASNRTAVNFGCSVQQNIAAQIADPRDLIAPRAETPADEMRRAVVFGHYEKGEPTASTKSADQSGSVSAIAK